MRASFESINGIRTRFLHHGSGEHGILMLHGVGVSADSWLWNLEGCGEACVAPDLLGYGFTEEGGYRDGPPHEGIIEHLSALVDRLGFARVSIIGSSFGANIACHLSWRLAQRVHRLVLVGCGPALNRPQTLSAMYEQSFANGIAAMSDPTLETCRRRMNNLVFDPACVPEALLMIQLTLYALPGARDGYERRMRGIKDRAALERFDVTRRLREVAVPTLVVWGRQDPRGSLEETQACVREIPQAQMVICENCGHLPYLEQPACFNDLVRDFLG